MKLNNRKLLIGVGISIFLYVLAFSVMNFFQGYHDVDLTLNFLNLGHKIDIGTNGQLNQMGEVYIRGLNQMKSAVVWLIFNTIFGIWIGYISRKING